jgi:hypothetical protein
MNERPADRNARASDQNSHRASSQPALRRRGRRWCALSIHCPGRSARAARFSGRLGHFVSKRPISLAGAAEPVIPGRRASASLDRDTASRRRLRPCSRLAARHRVAHLTGQPMGDHSSRCARRRGCRPLCRSVSGGNFFRLVGFSGPAGIVTSSKKRPSRLVLPIC